jgi:hypothetical protein
MSLLTNIVAYYKFDSSNSNDSVGSNNGTDTSISYNTSYGKINQGASFGTGSQILITAITTVTLNFWYLSSGFNGKTAFSRQDLSQYIQTNSGYLLLYNGGYSFTTIPFNETSYTMMTLVYTGSGYDVYKNGSFVSNVSCSQFNFDTISRSTSSAGWDGYLDEIGFWSRALTSTEITQLYNLGAGLQYPFSLSNPNFFMLM